MTAVVYLAKTDALSFLSAMEDESVDCVITDPPYESIEKHRRVGTTTRLSKSKGSSSEWFESFPNSRFPELLKHVYRVLKQNKHFYMLCDQETMFVVKPMAEAVGFKFWKPIVWDKVAIGMGYHYRARYEFILFFEKGKRKLSELGVPDILTHKRIRGGFPTEKPVQLMQTLVSQSTRPGDLVVDPFMGSGSTGVAAKNLGRRFSGCDIAQHAFDLTCERLNPDEKPLSDYFGKWPGDETEEELIEALKHI